MTTALRNLTYTGRRQVAPALPGRPAPARPAPTSARPPRQLARLAGGAVDLHALPVSLLQHAVQVTAEQGSVLFREGEPAASVYVVVDGRVKLVRAQDDGRETVLAVLGPGDHFGEVELLAAVPRHTTAVVIADASLARISNAAMHEWVTTHPRHGTQLLAVVAQRAYALSETYTDTLAKDVAARLATQLLELAQRFGSTTGSTTYVHHGLTQTELAQFVGSSRETVNKLLSSFARRGWISIESRGIAIHDERQLRARANR